MVVVLIVGVVVWMLANALWLHANRPGQPRSIDEWGYYGYALNDYYQSLRSGPGGWVEAVLAPSIQSPLTTALASLVFFAAGVNWVAAYAVTLAGGAIAILACFAYGRRVGGNAVGLFSAALLALTPAFIQFSRLFVFAAPATAVTTLAVIALLRMRGGRSLGWSIGFGVLLGLMPLTRTMTLSYMPALALVAVVQSLIDRKDRTRRVRNVMIAAFVTVGTAAIWFAGSWKMVFDYLFGFGYGKQSAAYSNGGSPFLRWISSFSASVNGSVLIVIVIGVLLAVGVALVELRRLGLRRFARRAALSPLFAGAVLLAEGLIALASSKNGGLGFALPLVPAACVIAAWGIASAIRSLRPSALNWIAIGVTIIVAALVTPSFGVRSPLSSSAGLAVPGAGSVTLLGSQTGDPAYNTPYSRSNARSLRSEWRTVSTEIAGELMSRPGAITTAFGFRDRYMNVNTIQVILESRLHYGSPLAQIDPTIYEPTVRGYTRWLTRGDAKFSCTLLTARGSVNEFTPLVNTSNLIAAAKKRGFVVIDAFHGPDGRTIVLWARTNGNCAVTPAS